MLTTSEAHSDAVVDQMCDHLNLNYLHVPRRHPNFPAVHTRRIPMQVLHFAEGSCLLPEEAAHGSPPMPEPFVIFLQRRGSIGQHSTGMLLCTLFSVQMLTHTT